MGCDIHAYIEYFSKEDYRNNSSKCFVDTFSGELDFGRNYVLFGLLAGVRSLSAPIFSPRGLPVTPSISFVCDAQYYTHVLDDELFNNTGTRILSYTSRHIISRTEAESAIANYGAKYANAEKSKLENYSYHTPSWLFAQELMLVRKHYLLENIEFYSELSGKKKKQLLNFINSKDEFELMRLVFPTHECTMLYSVINTMCSIEKCHADDMQSRLVFWFDS